MRDAAGASAVGSAAAGARAGQGRGEPGAVADERLPGPGPARADRAGSRASGRKDSYVRWERDAPMALWQLDIVGGVFLADGTEAKVVTGVDDHSRYCVIASVVARATGRAVCLAFAAALRAFGVPGEVLTDNGKQFTDRFGKGGEVLFDRICRDNGITHRLTQPRSPTTTGKIERFHGSLRRELLDDAVPFADLAAAQAAVDAWVQRVQHHPAASGDRDGRPGGPVQHRPAPRPSRSCCRCGCPPSWPWPRSRPRPLTSRSRRSLPARRSRTARPVVSRRPGGVRPGGAGQREHGGRWASSSGSAPARAGMTVTFWASTDVIHLTIAGARVKIGPLAPVRRGPGPRWPPAAAGPPGRRRCPRPSPAPRSRSTGSVSKDGARQPGRPLRTRRGDPRRPLVSHPRSRRTR